MTTTKGPQQRSWLQKGSLPIAGMALIFLTACGGGGGGGNAPAPTPPSAASFPITATAVKGPLALADVIVTRLAGNQPGLKGAVLFTSKTDSKAVLPRLTLTEPLDAYYLIEFRATAETRDLATGKVPVLPVLSTVISKAQLQGSVPVYATPMSTLALRLAEQLFSSNPSADAAATLQTATERAVRELGFGYPGTELFSTPALITADNSDLALILQFRSTNEALNSLLAQLRDASSLTPDQLLTLLANDLVDDALDGKVSGNALAFGTLGNLVDAINHAAIPWLPIPETDRDGNTATIDPFTVAATAELLLQEMTRTGIQRNVSALSSGQIQYRPQTRGADFDHDGYPDAVDDDDDNDNTPDQSDAFPLNAQEWADFDGDVIGDNADLDDDNDAVADAVDAFPRNAAESADTDLDGIGNNADPDDDNDSVADGLDAFPLDPNESVDSDQDGTGDNADSYPDQAACHRAGDGDGNDCYVSILVTQGYDKLLHDPSGVSYFLSNTRREIIRLSADGSEFLAPIPLTLSHGNVTAWAYSANHNRLYLGYGDGAVRSIRVASELVELDVVQLTAAIGGLADAGRYLLVQDASGAWATHHLVSASGVITDSAEWNYMSGHYAWSASNSRLYFFRDSMSPNDLHYERIDQTNGTITETGETPYHGSYNIIGPIRVSVDGSKILLGSGDMYAASNLQWQGSLGGMFTDAVWDSDGGMLVLKSSGANSVLLRRDATMKTVETLPIDGAPVAVVPFGSQYKVLTRTSQRLEVRLYTPSDDTDQDGVNNETDAFPTDSAAALDSDADGYPDQWNAGKGPADSNTGLTLDAFPNDAACWLSSHGSNGVCDFSATMPDFTPDQVFQTDDGTVHLFSKVNRKIYRWSPTSDSYLNPLVVGLQEALTTTAPDYVAYSPAHQRIYLGYGSGQIRYLALNNPTREQPLASTAMAVTGLASAGQYLMASDTSGAWHTHYVISQTGFISQAREWNYFSRHWTWDAGRSRMYFFRDDTSPNDLHYEQVNQSTGQIDAQGESPYHGDYNFTGPIRLRPNGNQIVIGGGHIFNAADLTHVRNLQRTFKDAAWSTSNLITATEAADNTTLRMWTADGDTVLDEFAYTGSPQATLLHSDELLLVLQRAGKPAFERLVLADRDSDGLPGWWEARHGLSDQNPADAASDGDSDGLNNLQEFQRRTIPTDSDSDNDGLSDGVEVNLHGTNPLVADSDADGLDDGQEVTVHHTSPTNADSDGDTLSDGAEVNQHHTNPLVADSDSDGMNDDWELDNGLDPNVDDANTDADSDGLNNLAERNAGTDPNDPDSDSDGLTDGAELNSHGSNPLQADSDSDRMKDGWEVSYALSPINAADANSDSDSDGFSNREEFYGSTDPRDALSFPRPQAWQTYQGNAAHTGYVPLTLTPAQFSLRWSLSIGSEWSVAQVAAGPARIYLTAASTKRIVALNAVDGAEAWSYTVTNSDSMSGPAIINGKVYFQTGGHSNSFLRALDADDGSLQFSAPYGNQWSNYLAPTPYADGVYIAGGYYGGSYGFAAADGSQRWFTSLNQYDLWTPAVDDQFAYAYTGSYSPQLTAIDRSTGSVAFRIDDPGFVWNGWSMQTAPALGIEAVFATNGARLIKFDLATRQIGWQVNGGFSGQPTVANETVFVLKNGALVAIDDRNGQQLWTWTPTSGAALTGNIVATRNLVFVHDGNNSYAVDRSTHSEVWLYPAAGEIAISDEGAIIIAGASGTLTVINYSGDQDADGMPDWWETAYGFNLASATDATDDPDLDGLANLAEFQQRTDPTLSDTDEDGLSDGDEINTYHTLPKDSDTDDDQLLDGDEVAIHSTDPIEADSDQDDFADGAEINRYHTDPNDASSRPNALDDFVESFEAGAIPAGWTNAPGSETVWIIDSAMASAGSMSLRSGTISHGGRSGMSFEGLFANSTLSFKYRTDTEACCDHLRVYVDGVEKLSASGINTWTSAQLVLPLGEHTIEWRYTKDGSVSTGADAVWIDEITLTNN